MTLSKEKLEHYAANTEVPVKEMARELLERRERDKQEPVAYMVGGYNLLHAHDPKVDEYLNRATPLYAAPQLSQPSFVMSEEQSKRLFDEWSGGDDALAELRANGVPEEFISMLKEFSLSAWNACRAAMLKGGQS